MVSVDVSDTDVSDAMVSPLASVSAVPFLSVDSAASALFAVIWVRPTPFCEGFTGCLAQADRAAQRKDSARNPAAHL